MDKIFSVGLLVLIFVLGQGKSLLAADGSGLQTSVAVDIVGGFASDKNSDSSNRVQARETELMLYGPIDHLFDGVLSIAAHPEGGESFFEIHEAYISSSKLIPRTRFKVGKFFLGIGRLNRFHRHDWPFVMAPEIHRIVIAEKVQRSAEGAEDSGAEFSTLLPTPFFLDLTVGATNGYTYGHTHEEGERPRVLTHYSRLATAFEIATSQWETGFSYLGRTNSQNREMILWGWDLVGKVREGKRLVFLWQSEVWSQVLAPAGVEKQEILGGYFYPQYGITNSLSFGTRIDYTTVRSQKDAEGNKINNHYRALEPTLSYKPSEFSTFRMAWQFQEDSPGGGKGRSFNRNLLLQSAFILGAHPAHEF